MAKFKVIAAAINRLVDGEFVSHKIHELVELSKSEAGRLLALRAVAPVNADGEVTAMPEPVAVSPHIENDIEEPSAFAQAAAAASGKHSAPEPAESADDPDAGSTPRGNASLEEWQAFAKEQGATDDELAGKTRDEIRAMFGPAAS